MKKYISIISLLLIAFQIHALEFKRDVYGSELDVRGWDNNPLFTDFYNKFGFRQIEIYNGKYWDKYYLIDGVTDYALMSFNLFDNSWIDSDYKTFEEFKDEYLPEYSIAYAKNFKASSTLKDKTYTYDVKNIFDKAPPKKFWLQNLPWAEGKDDEGIGEYIEFEIMSANELLDRMGDWTITSDITVSILNGFVNPMKQKLFYENNRIKKAAVWIDGKRSFELDFNDYVEFTEFTVPKQTKKIKIEILEVYKGTKYNDTCVTKIDVNYDFGLDPDSEFNKEL